MSDLSGFVCRLIQKQGFAQFGEKEAFRAMWPSKSLAWLRLAGFDVRPFLGQLCDSGHVVQRLGLRGGRKWQLTDRGAGVALRFAQKQHADFLFHHLEKTGAQKKPESLDVLNIQRGCK